MLFNAKLYVRYNVNDNDILKEYEKVTADKIAELSNLLEDLIYSHKAVDARLEYTELEGQR